MCPSNIFKVPLRVKKREPVSVPKRLGAQPNETNNKDEFFWDLIIYPENLSFTFESKLYLLWWNAKMVPSPKSQDKLALLEDTFILWLDVRLVLYHIPSVQIPWCEKHGDGEKSKARGTSWGYYMVQGQVNHYWLNGVCVKGCVRTLCSLGQCLINLNARTPGLSRTTAFGDCSKEAGKNMTCMGEESGGWGRMQNLRQGTDFKVMPVSPWSNCSYFTIKKNCVQKKPFHNCTWNLILC